MVGLGVVDEGGAEDGGQQEQEQQHHQHVCALQHAGDDELDLGDARAQLEDAKHPHEPDDPDDPGVGPADADLVLGEPEHQRPGVYYHGDVEGNDGHQVDEVEGLSEGLPYFGGAGNLQNIFNREDNHTDPFDQAQPVVVLLAEALDSLQAEGD
eukprot:scaffold74481_cov47-Prasinocladus_malaysianus.AAC.2